jgi:MFS family permease
MDKPALTVPREGLKSLTIATFIASLGVGVTTVAYPWLAASITRSPLLLSTVSAASQLPAFLLALPIGVFIDRSNLKRVLYSAHLLRAVLMLSLAGLIEAHYVTIPLICLQAMLLGVITLMSDNAQQTIVPMLVPDAELPRANSRLFAAREVTASFVGPLAGGLLLSAALAIPFISDAIAFVLAGAFVTLIPALPTADKRPSSSPPARAELLAGLHYFWDHKVLRGLGLMLAGLSFTEGLMMSTLVLFAQDILRLNSRTYGLMFLAGAVGGLIGMVIYPMAERRLGERRVLLVALAGFGASSVVVAVTSSAILAAMAFAASIALIALWNIVTISYRQRVSPRPMLGRLTAIHRLLGMGALPLGTIIGGSLATAAAPLGHALSLRVPFLLTAGTDAVLFIAACRIFTPQRWESAPAPKERASYVIND